MFKTIILGVFKGHYFHRLKFKFQAECYNKIANSILISDFDLYQNSSVIELINYACHNCDEIIFLLDEITVPINTDKSVTCKELKLILSNGILFNKTRFFLKEEEMSNEEVKEMYQ